MVVLKLSILDLLKQTCSMKGRSMDLKEDKAALVISFVHIWCFISHFLMLSYNNKLNKASFNDVIT